MLAGKAKGVAVFGVRPASGAGKWIIKIYIAHAATGTAKGRLGVGSPNTTRRVDFASRGSGRADGRPEGAAGGREHGRRSSTSSDQGSLPRAR